MKDLLDKILHSFHTGPQGFSARKLTAFVITACVVYAHFAHVNDSNVVSALVVDASFVSLLLGIVTAEQIIKLKNGPIEKSE